AFLLIVHAVTASLCRNLLVMDPKKLSVVSAVDARKHKISSYFWFLLPQMSCFFPHQLKFACLFLKRESALEQADEEEEQKLFQSKAKRTSRAIAKSGVNSETLKQQKKKNEAEEMIKNKRTVFVGNLPVNSTMLKSLFKEYGQIESIRFRSVVSYFFRELFKCVSFSCSRRKIHPNVKYINAYVVFKEECDAIKALKKNGTEIASGFHIRVDIASKNSLVRDVCFIVLPADISDDAVREHFAECGDVVAVRIVRDRQTGMGKGFGYILFENTDAVHLALKLNDSALQGRKVRVKRCVEKGSSARRAAGRPRGPKGRARSAAPAGSVHSASFVGEKAVPCARGAKTKRLGKGAAKRKPGKKK
uniref:RNA binding motif protein 34 n=1 Tax=Cairina moschata TaxID=8855 RepID=A0A8C3CK42_CAIMO